MAAFAPWPVHRDSVGSVRFAPQDKKKLASWFHQAKEWNEREPARQRVCRPLKARAAALFGGAVRFFHGRGYGGKIGTIALRVLEALIFGFLNHKTGRLDPSYEAIARKINAGRSTVAEALRWLRALGIITWQRRCRKATGKDGRFELHQDSNAYVILPPSQWRGFRPSAPPAPPPEPDTWGATPPLPSIIESYLEERTVSGRSLLDLLESDPTDVLATLLAKLGRSIGPPP